MRCVDTKEIYLSLKQIILKALVVADCNGEKALKCAFENEDNETAKFALKTILENIEIAKNKQRPLCQDTGMAVVFLEIGQDVFLQGEFVGDVVNSAVRDAYEEGCFRKSVLDPITRINTKDNTPCILHTEIVKGDKIEISFLPKGFGSENMTKTYMLNPSDGIEGIKNCVIEAVKVAGSSPCPPIVVGVGIGGTLDKAVTLSKKALLRETGKPSDDKFLSELEKELLTKINSLGIGAQGFGGKNTALSVAVEKFPTHIAGLPVCVSLQCHSIRVGHAEV